MISDLHISADIKGSILESGVICLSEDFQKIVVLVDERSKEWRLPVSNCAWVQSNESEDPANAGYILENSEDTARRVISEMIGNNVSLNGYAMTLGPIASPRMVHSDRIRPVFTAISRDRATASQKMGSTDVTAWYWATFTGDFERLLVKLGNTGDQYLVRETVLTTALLKLPDILLDLVKNLRDILPVTPRGAISECDARIETVDGISKTKRSATYWPSSSGFKPYSPRTRVPAPQMSLALSKLAISAEREH
ncbi:hypothetical protein MMC26_005546 [Xylographa opegraphella]|nr:hypothetical protein [Xylographa opegraphella]